MSVNRLFLLGVLLALVPVFVVGQEVGATWVQVAVKSNWPQTSLGFCRDDQGCLVSNAFNEIFDGNPRTYWDGLSVSALGPKCINDSQSILDHYCDKGNWTSRTRLVAQQLLGIALNASPQNFSLYCDGYREALNRFGYATEFGQVEEFFANFCPQRAFVTGNLIDAPCANNVCVLKYGGKVAMGMSLNEVPGAVDMHPNIDDPQRSVLHAFNLDSDVCSSELKFDGHYHWCGGGIWYNHLVQSIIYVPDFPVPQVIDPVLPDPASLANDFFLVPFRKLQDYTFSVVNKPSIPRFNFSFFGQTPDFNFVYIAKNVNKLVYGFKEENVTLRQLDYGGWYLSNIALSNTTCARIVKTFDHCNANCEVQISQTEFYVVAAKTPECTQSVVDAFGDATGKLRVS